MDLLNKLGIDWKLLIAQVVNFAILALILYKFVYKTVLDTLEKRSKAIEKGMHDAKMSEQRLQEIEKMSADRMRETSREIGSMLEKAKKDAEGVKQEILSAATAQSDDLMRKTKTQVAEEKEKMLQEVKAEVGTLVLKLTAKMLEREFNAADQKRLSDAISSEMKSL